MTDPEAKPIVLSVEVTRVIEAEVEGQKVWAKSTYLLEKPVVDIQKAHRKVIEALKGRHAKWVNQGSPDQSNIRIVINEKQTQDKVDDIGKIIAKKLGLPDKFIT